MKLKKYIVFLAAATVLGGCDFLEFDESQGREQYQAYETFENIYVVEPDEMLVEVCK